MLPGLPRLNPIVVVGIGDRDEQLGAPLQFSEQPKYVITGGRALPYQLEQPLAAHLGQLAEHMVAEQLRKPLLLNGVHERSPAALQCLQVGAGPDAREQVVLEQIRGSQLQAAGIERLEYGISIQLVVDGDQDEQQLPRHGLGEETCYGSAVVPQFGQLVQTVAEGLQALPEEPIGLRQAPGVQRFPDLYQVNLVEAVVGFVQVQPTALGERRRVLFADKAVAQLTRPFVVGFRLDPLACHGMQTRNDGEREHAERGEALLAVNDQKLAVAPLFDHQGAQE